MNCGNCGSQIPKLELYQGELNCSNCGFVLESSAIASDLTFDSQNVVGKLVSYKGRSFKTAKGYTRDSSEVSLVRAERQLQKIAANMKISPPEAARAFSLYTLVKDRKFKKGYKIDHLIVAALYVVCRMEKASLLLADFADELGEDLLVLGSVYRKVINQLKMPIPPIDPSLFIHRFCKKLQFKQKTEQIARTAIKFVQRMNRDWMSLGRRPTGICGTAILIAAKYHGVKRSTQHILQVVGVCNDTIRKRIQEFDKTKLAQLTREQFENIDLQSIQLGESDPPSFR